MGGLPFAPSPLARGLRLISAAARERPPHDERELIDVERLRQVVDGAELHGVDGGPDRSGGGQHDDRDVRAQVAQATQDVEAVHAGHDEVEEHEVDRLAGDAGERARAVAREKRLVDALEEHPQGFADPGLVVDDEDARHRTAPCQAERRPGIGRSSCGLRPVSAG